MMFEANEIQEVMGRSYGIGDDIDEAVLEAEFDALGSDPKFLILNDINSKRNRVIKNFNLMRTI